MPGKKDSVSDIASRGCVKCCAYCRISPEGSALCYGGVALLLVTIVLYFMGSVLAGVASQTDPRPNIICSTVDPFNGSIHEVYLTYLKVTGGVVVLVIIAVILGCCAACGLLCGFPRPIKIVSLVCLIPTVLFFLFYLAWMGLGTYLLTRINSDKFGSAVCQHILMFMIIFWFYLLCLCVFGVLMAVWKICALKKGSKPAGGQLIGGGSKGASIV